jgi:hypothetical protein
MDILHGFNIMLKQHMERETRTEFMGCGGMFHLTIRQDSRPARQITGTRDSAE